AAGARWQPGENSVHPGLRRGRSSGPQVPVPHQPLQRPGLRLLAGARRDRRPRVRRPAREPGAGDHAIAVGHLDVDFDPSRLRRGEWLVGGGALVLVVSLFVPWYASLNGWHGLENLRWLVLVTVLVALALVWFQATRRSPAVPVTFSAMVIVVGLLNLIAL